MTQIIKDNGKRSLTFAPERLSKFIAMVGEDCPTLDLTTYTEKAIRFISNKDTFTASDISDHLIREAEANLTIDQPEWEAFAARLFLRRLYKRAARNRFYLSDKAYGPFLGLLQSLGEQGIYAEELFAKYSKEELEKAGRFIDPSRDLLFTYNGLSLLANRYLATPEKGQVYELPQERWLVIALYLMQDEAPKKRRLELVKDAYWALSGLNMTVATPTLTNAGKSNAQLSSCFVLTSGDSLQSIYDTNTDAARVSKHGGGVGVYMGHVRSSGSDIRGMKGASGGVIPWIKQLNNTAVSVDQLGQRKGAITVTLDVWHKDIMGFLDLRLNNGDQRLRAHDIFTCVSIPDVFMEAVESRGDWHLFDPHEVEVKKGWRLEDFHDAHQGRGEFRKRYRELVEDNSISRVVVPALDIMKRIMISQLETGTPFMFYRDSVNRMNPNSHVGMVYSSNLCQEICQNMSETEVIHELISGDQIVITKKAGDFVVCNLSSINLGKWANLTQAEKERLLTIQVRMLDNVIDLNHLPAPQATITNQKYRSVGLGTFGWHHYLALKGIDWESEAAVEETDRLYEEINAFAIKSSALLAKEKGTYKAYTGSDWQTGRYFTKRDYDIEEDPRWVEVWDLVFKYGMRNAYLMAVAPNMSTAQIAGSTASIDPIFDAFYYEEKKDYRRPVIAPDMNPETYAYYAKGAYRLDQTASVKQNIARQRHVDQAISFNYFVPSTFRARKLLELHMMSWKGGVKTTYYVRSNDINVEECDWCSS